MIAYFDTSALIKLLVMEDGSDVADRVWEGATAVVSSRLAYPEARAALADARRADRLVSAQLARAKLNLEIRWRQMRGIEVRPEIAVHAGDLAERHGLRGYDAVHLASALAIREVRPTVVTWDADLAVAALAERLGVAPPIEA